MGMRGEMPYLGIIDNQRLYHSRRKPSVLEEQEDALCYLEYPAMVHGACKLLWLYISLHVSGFIHKGLHGILQEIHSSMNIHNNNIKRELI